MGDVTVTPPTKNPIDAGRSIADHAIRLAKLELELRTVELKGKAARAGLGVGLGLLSVLLAPLLVVFLLAALVAALATAMHVWLAILIVSAVLLVLVGALAGAAALLLGGVMKGRSDDTT